MGDEHPKNEGPSLTPIEALHAACARNAPLEVVQADLAGIEPFARGRMIEIESGVLMIEEVQVIGKVTKFAKETPVIGFFRFGSRLYEFNSKVVSSAKPVQLNRATIVPALDLKFPHEITEGQRRNVYRIPVAALREPITIEFWRETPPDVEQISIQNGLTAEGDGVCDAFKGGEDAQGLLLPPTRNPDWRGNMIDASDVGLGVNLMHCRLNQMRVFDRGWLRFTLPGDEAGAMTFFVEVRQVRSVREGVVRLGTLIIESNDRWAHAAKVRRLWSFLTEWQRRVCRVIDTTTPGAS